MQKVAKHMLVVIPPPPPPSFSLEENKNTLKLHLSQPQACVDSLTVSLFLTLKHFVCIWSFKRLLERFVNNSLWRQKWEEKLAISTKKQLPAGRHKSG